MKKKFEGRTAIVVGGGSGMGLLTACQLGAEGAAVVVADVNGDAAAACAGTIGDSGAAPGASLAMCAASPMWSVCATSQWPRPGEWIF